MAKYCSNCGREIPDGTAFCPECGTAAPKEAAEGSFEPKPAQARTMYYQSGYENPQTERNAVVSTGAFFGLIFLFALPVIGWIICVIMAFASKNENTRHFARAMMIWLIIGAILSVIGYFLMRWLGGMLVEYLSTEYAGQLGDLQELLEQFKLLESGEFTLPTN